MHVRLSSLALLCAGLTAQTGEYSEGPLIAIPSAMSVDGATSLPAAHAASIVFTRSNLTATPPGVWSPKAQFPTLPDLSILPFMSLSTVDVDALSIGMDKVDATPNGVMAPFGVGSVLYSVTRATVGAAASLIASEVAGVGGAAGDIFSYTLPNSFGEPSYLDRPLRSHDAREISVHSASAPGNVDAHDLCLGLFFQENPHLSVFVPGIPDISVYFSVSTASVAAVPPLWWNGATPSGAIVLRTVWSQATNTWSRPQPAYLPSDFGLQNSEDVDALALDLGRNFALISTVVAGSPVQRNPVLFVNLSVPGVNHVYRRADGVPASERFGLTNNGIDDIDSLTAIEPVSTNPLPYNHVVGTQFPRLLAGLPGRLSNTVTMRLNAAGTNEEVVTRMIGAPVPGPVGNGLAVVTMALGVNLPANYATMSSLLRPNATSPFFAFQGHPEEFTITIPTSPSFAGAPLFFTWGAFDFTASVFDLSTPIGITL